jgi:hypothetical protein
MLQLEVDVCGGFQLICQKIQLNENQIITVDAQFILSEIWKKLVAGLLIFQ